MERKDAYLWLKSISGISTKTIEKINNQVNNIENVIEFFIHLKIKIKEKKTWHVTLDLLGNNQED